jgi:cytochrome b subunit of formate dehydrogenase
MSAARNRTLPGWTAGFGVAVSLAIAPVTARSQDAAPAEEPVTTETCLACHGEPGAERFVNPQRFAASVHAALSCAGCHADAIGIPHDVPLKPVTCNACHQLESEIYRNSDHGRAVHQGNDKAASCRDCHGEPHAILEHRNPASPVFRANVPSTCGTCHQQTEAMAKFHLGQLAPIATYDKSVHGLALHRGVSNAAVCTDCHGSHDLHRATNPASKLYWQRIPETCGQCHQNIAQTFARSVHGQAVGAGKRDAPVCTDCHGEHSIDAVKQATSSVFPANIPETCGQCHGAERIISKYRLPGHVVDTYMDSFHGLALQLGSVTAANCASCHGAHDILPSDDLRSSVNPNNLAKTCGTCHPGVTSLVAAGQIHSGTRPGLEHRAVSLVRQFYLWLIMLVIGGMVVHNGLDFSRKLSRHYAASRSRGAPGRMNRNERIQHGVLIAAFAALAYTGFALHYPNAWWAAPMVGRMDWRSFAHRAAAALFVLLSVYHAWFILWTPRGRAELQALRVRADDLRQLGQTLAFYLGWRAERPTLGHYSYVEKAEYWALVWGSIIMTLTGALMTWQDWTLRFFPKWFFDVVRTIHFYEAVLACLAIVVWHFYFTVFDPEEYPMKWTWVTGRSSEADAKHRSQDEEPPVL